MFRYEFLLMRKLLAFLLLSSLFWSLTASATQGFQSVYLQANETVQLRKQIRKWIPDTPTDNPEVVFQALRDGKFVTDQELRIRSEENAWYAFRYYVEPGFIDPQVLLRFIVGRNYVADVFVLDGQNWEKISVPDFDNPLFKPLFIGSYAVALPADDTREYWVLIKPVSEYPIVLKTELTTDRAYFSDLVWLQVPTLLACGAVMAMIALVLAWKWRNPGLRSLFLAFALLAVFSRLLHVGYLPALYQWWWFYIGEVYASMFMLEQILFLVLVMKLVDIHLESAWLRRLSWGVVMVMVAMIPLSVTLWINNWFFFSIFRGVIVLALVLEFVLVIRAVLIGRDTAIYVTLATVATFGITCFQIWRNIDLLQSEMIFLAIRETTFVLMVMALTIAILRYGKEKLPVMPAANDNLLADLSSAWANDVYTLSQELRTPTTGVIGMAQLLQRSGLDQSQRHYANVIVASTNEIVDTLSAVLDITRINSKNFHLDSVPFSIEQLFQFLADFFEFDMTEVESHIDGKFSDKMPLFYIGDQVRLQEVLAIAMRTLLRFTTERLQLNISREEDGYSSDVILKFVIDARDIRLSQEARQRFVDILKDSDDSLMLFGGARGSAELGLVLIRKIIREMYGQIGIEQPGNRAMSIWFTVKLQIDNNKQLKFDRDQAQLRNKQVAVIYSSTMFAENIVKHFCSWGMDARVISDASDWQTFPIDEFDIIAISNACKWPVAKVLEMAAEKNIPVLLSDSFTKNQVALTDLPVMRIANLSMGSTLSDMMGAMVNLILNRDITALNKAPDDVGRFRQCKVLLAEDNPVNQQVVMAMLRNLGVDADCVNDGSEVLPLIFDRPEYYDLILMDYDMPQMNGIETARALRMRRRNSAFKSLTICCLTAHATSDVREQCIAAGMDAVLVKPISMSVLEDYLSSVVERLDNCSSIEEYD